MEGGRRTEKNNNKEKKKFFVHFQKYIFYPFAKPVDQWHVFGSKSMTHSGAKKTYLMVSLIKVLPDLLLWSRHIYSPHKKLKGFKPAQQL